MDRLKNNKDRIVGKIVETTGKVTNMEDMEFKGKLQGMKADISDKMEDMKEGIFDKANDLVDKARDNKKGYKKGDKKDNWKDGD